MKLFYTPTSPFVRKVLVAAHELGLAARLELELLRPTPLKSDTTLSAVNPLNKIPALVLPDGSALYDSPVICEYLDSLAGGGRLLPAAGPARFSVLRTQALSDGILEAAIAVFYEGSHRPPELRFQGWVDGQSEKALQGLGQLEADSAGFGSNVDLGQICAGITLGWLEFRKPLGELRARLPRLFDWYQEFRERPSMRATEPHL